MKNFLLFGLAILHFCYHLFSCPLTTAASQGDYRFSVAYGNWEDAFSWRTYKGSRWVVATKPPGATNNVFIGANAEAIISSLVQCKNLTFSGAGEKTIITFLADAVLIVNGDAHFKDEGRLELNGSAISAATTPVFRVKGFAKIMLLASLKVNNVSLFLEKDFILEGGYFEGGGEVQKKSKTPHFIGGNLLLKKSQFILSTGSDPGYQIDGSISLADSAELVGISGNSGSPVLNVQHEILTESGSLFRACNNSKPKKNTMLYVNFTNDSGWSKESRLSTGAGLLDFETLWRFTISQGRRIILQADLGLGGLLPSTSFTSFTVEAGGILNTDGFKIYTVGITSDSRFLLNTDALLEIGHPQGISNAPEMTGAIQTSKRKYNETAFYGYTGNSNQITGKGLPSVIKKLIINNSGPTGMNSVLLSNPYLSIGGNSCQIFQGIFDVDTNTFTGHNCIFSMQGGGLRIAKISKTILLPELMGAYILDGGFIELCGNGFQQIRGAIAYFNLTLSGNNISGSTFKFPSSHVIINNQLEIRNRVILDAIDGAGSAVSISGPGGLLMLDNSWFRMKKLNATLPELRATAPGSDYTLMGGTIELYGTDSNQTHSLNGTKGTRGADIGYFNVVLNARSLNAKEVNVVLQSSAVINNNFIVNAPTAFQISNAFSLKGPGSFELAAAATLQYGSPQGISKLPNKGNIRMTGKIKFSPNSNFGLVGSLPMETGNLLPDTIHNLFISKKNVVLATVSKHVAVAGTLRFERGILETKDSGLLTILAGAEVSGASDASHVSGPVVKYGNSGFIFPIGNKAKYRPLGISELKNATSMFKATYFNLDPTSLFGGTPDKGLDHISQCEFWDLQAEKAEEGCSITLSWNENSCGVDAPSDLRVAHFNPSKIWLNDSNASLSYLTGTSGMVQSKVLKIGKLHAPFCLASINSSNPLPISLLQFDVCFQLGNADLTWSTASETNCDFYTIERSYDGVSYFSLGKTKGFGNAIVMHNYAFRDPGLMPGKYYYRLGQTDNDGVSHLYGPIVLSVPESSLIIARVFYDGAIMFVNLNDVEDAPRKIKIMDFLGQELHTSESSEKKLELKLNVPLTSGIYFLQVTRGNETKIKKIIL
jgi:hypothetical protein